MTYSDPFTFLGLDRKTATDADVRRVYAERLKATRPEEDRAAFMALRSAFERARNEVRWRDEYGEDDVDEDDVDEAVGETPVHTAEPAAREDALPAASVTEPAAEEPDEAYDEEDYDDYVPTEFDARISRAMDTLKDLMTASNTPADVSGVMAIIDAPEISGIDEYQAMQWNVREFLCERTGGNQQYPELRVPGWLSVELFDALDGYYGWTRQPATQSWIRQKNDWLVRAREAMADSWIYGDPGKPRLSASARRSRAQETQASQGDGSLIWLWVGAGILLSQVLRYWGDLSGG
jgi:hypothetical protein